MSPPPAGQGAGDRANRIYGRVKLGCGDVRGSAFRASLPTLGRSAAGRVPEGAHSAVAGRPGDLRQAGGLSVRPGAAVMASPATAELGPAQQAPACASARFEKGGGN